MKDNIRLAFEQAEHERQFLIKRVTEGKATSSKKQGRPEGKCNIKTDKAEYIKQAIKDLSKDFDGKYSDAKILREYLHNTSKRTYYKYKKELKEEILKIAYFQGLPLAWMASGSPKSCRAAHR